MSEEIKSDNKGWNGDEENVEGQCFMATTSKSPMLEKVRGLLISINISSNSYNSILYDIDDAYNYLNGLLISMSNDLEKTKAELYDARNRIKEKNSKIESLNLNLNNVTIDRDSVRMHNILLIKHRNIYCNTTKHLYGKITMLYHSSEISKGQHRKLLHFITFKKELVMKY